MQIADAQQNGVRIVAPAGRIDSTTATEFERHLIACVTRGDRRLVVDLTGVDYISSAGLRVLLIAARRVQETGGRLGLCGLGDAVRHVFQLAGFLPLFAIRQTRDDAVAHVTTP